jgi:hypothetical protein
MSEIIIEKKKEKIPFIEIKMKKEYDMSPTGQSIIGFVLQFPSF